MGFSPQQVDAMSMWQFMAAADGYAEAHSAGGSSLSETEASEIWEWMKARPAPTPHRKDFH